MNQKEIDILKRALLREKTARKESEKILEEKSRILYDTTQKLEVLLLEKSTQLKGVFENIVDAYVVMDINGNILKFNDAATELFGHNIIKEHLNVKELVYKDDLEYAFASFLELTKVGFFKNYEARIYTKFKGVRWVHINASVIYDKDKNPIAAQGIVRDVTDLKALELQKEKLLLKLEKSNEELQEYAHIVSHDLKSPLRSIDALLNWLKEDNKDTLDAASLQNIEHIEGVLEKMEQLISDILDYSSFTAENSKITDVSTDKLLKELLQILFVPRHIELKLPSNLPVVRGDKTKLQQVFQNLITNAIKFSDKSQGLIEIAVDDLEGFYQFSIKDNGIGIEKQYHDKIFKIFNVLNKSKDSTGIGLSIVKKIISLHEGKIWLESQPTIGTTFYFTLKKVL